MAMHEDAQLAQLRRMRRIATALLALMALLFLGVRLLAARHVRLPDGWAGVLALAGAFAEAALVGALADWFAVTALFRHPFGLPIPHTAIVARNKDRLGAGVGNFLQHNFMTPAVMHEQMAHVDFSAGAAAWLAQPANRSAVAAQLVGALPALLRMADERALARFVRAALSDALARTRLAPLLADALSVLVTQGQHLVLFEQMLALVARALEQQRPYIRQKVHENSPGWMPRAFDEKLYQRLMEGVQGVLAEVRSEGSAWRERFQDATQELIDNLRASPEYEAKLRALLAGGAGHAQLNAYAAQLWALARQLMQDDALAPRSRLAALLEQGLDAFGRLLASDPDMNARLNGALRALVADTVVAQRGAIAALVRRVIENWDGDTVARKFELYVGKDLQYIRINGTLVGGLVGVFLYALGRWL
ncbi:MAG: DUF445 domain-containing protein [Pseudomonadota bacterium]